MRTKILETTLTSATAEVGTIALPGGVPTDHVEDEIVCEEIVTDVALDEVVGKEDFRNDLNEGSVDIVYQSYKDFIPNMRVIEIQHK